MSRSRRLITFDRSSHTLSYTSKLVRSVKPLKTSACLDLFGKILLGGNQWTKKDGGGDEGHTAELKDTLFQMTAVPLLPEGGK